MIKKLSNCFITKPGKFIVLTIIVFFISGCSFSDMKKIEPSDMEKTKNKKEVIIPEGNSYFNYLLSELEGYRQDRQKSFDYLIKAQKKDPESIFLKKKLASYYLMYKKPELAKELISGILEKTPEDTEILAIHARILAFEQKDSSEIAEIYKKILEIDPENKSSPIALAFLYEKMNKRQELIEIFEKAEIKSKENYFLYFYLGEAYLIEKKYSKAKKTLYKAVKEEPYRIEPKLSLIEAIKNMETSIEHKNEIIDLFNEIIELKPHEKAPLIELSYFYNQNGEYEKSDETFKAIAESWNSEKQETAVLLNFYVKNQSGDKADFAANRIFQATGDDSVFMILGSIYEKEGLKNKALETYKFVPETSQIHPEAISASAMVLASMGEFEKGIFILTKYLKKTPENLLLLSTLGSIYEGQNNYEKAESVYLKGSAISSERQWTFFYKLGVINDRAGKKNKAIDYMKKALELNPENPDTLNYLGYTYAEMGIELEAAKEMIEKALSSRKNDGYIIDSLGWVYFKMGNYEKAKIYLQKAAEIVKNDPVILEHLGDLYIKIEKYEKAAEIYNEILNLYPENNEVKAKLMKMKEQ